MTEPIMILSNLNKKKSNEFMDNESKKNNAWNNAKNSIHPKRLWLHERRTDKWQLKRLLYELWLACLRFVRLWSTKWGSRTMTFLLSLLVRKNETKMCYSEWAAGFFFWKTWMDKPGIRNLFAKKLLITTKALISFQMQSLNISLINAIIFNFFPIWVVSSTEIPPNIKNH